MIHLIRHRGVNPVTTLLKTGPTRVEGPARPDLRSAWVFLALMLMAAVGAIYDAVDPNKAALLPLVVAPILASLLLPIRPTAVLASFSVVLALVVPQGFVTTSGIQVLRFSALLGLALMAILGSVWRQRLADTRIRLAVSNAQAADARRRAVELNDGVYQKLFTARMWSEMGDTEAAIDAIDQALAGTAHLLDDLVEQGNVTPGSFVNRGTTDQLGMAEPVGVSDERGVIDLRVPYIPAPHQNSPADVLSIQPETEHGELTP